MPFSLPAGYERIAAPGVEGASRAWLIETLTTALASGSLYDYARTHEARREMVGRGPVYAIAINDVRVVVRHGRHGGLLAPFTRDLFIGETRAPYELDVSIRLRDGGVATPEVLAYATYRAGPGLRRVDVLTREITNAADLLTVLTPATPTAERDAIWTAVELLIENLTRVGALHADLNAKNVLIARAAGRRPLAYALDVDRVIWRRPGDQSVRRANWARLNRSARKRGLR